MRILLDACISLGTLKELRRAGHDVERIDSDLADEEVLSRARRETRILITADKDFGALVFLEKRTSFGILRLIDHPLSLQPSVVLATLHRYEGDLAQGSLVVVEPGRVRVRAAPTS